ncbi:hypothetical protein [Aquimarina sp. I32.4]|uniref:hypothetical protein n=1 Tax=Aquimarina sp. I32.4 TaxID=2053903 RepID=UPI000CDECFA9|nr:hypothetical protein [Aquimarina sp. I32.4]
MALKNKLGCFSFPAIILVSIIGSGFIQALVPLSLYTTFVCLLLLLSWIIGKSKNSGTQKWRWKYVMYSVFLLGCISGFRYVLDQIPLSLKNQYSSDISEHIYREKIFKKGDSIVLLRQDRKWSDNYGNTFEGKFAVREKDYFQSKKAYWNSQQEIQKKHSWGKLYHYLATADTPKLDLILEELATIKKTNQLNQFEFAEMVVTFIQDIPYSLVFESQCESPDRYEKSIRVVLERCADCCIGNIPFGIQNPVGFMGNLKGDCDTRTVIIYAILSHFGYEVAILNSDYYKHSVLGVHIPAKGLYKVQNGRRYYVWETTNKHFTIGTLPKNFGNINHWNIVLTNT